MIVTLIESVANLENPDAKGPIVEMKHLVRKLKDKQICYWKGHVIEDFEVINLPEIRMGDSVVQEKSVELMMVILEMYNVTKT